MSIFVVLWNNLDIENTIEQLQKINLYFLLIALLAYILHIFLAVWRWRVILKNMGVKIRYSKVLAFFWIGLFFNQVLPSNIGGDAIRAYYLHKEGVKLLESTIGVMVDRLTGLLGLLLMVIIILPSFLGRVDNREIELGIFLIISIAIIAVIAILFFSNFTKKYEGWKLVYLLNRLSDETKRQLLSKRTGLLLLLTTLMMQLMLVFVVYIIAIGLAIDVNFIEMGVVIPITLLIMVIPISVSGWGVREGVMVVGLGYLMVSGSSALALALLFGMLTFVIALPGSVVWWSHKLC